MFIIDRFELFTQHKHSCHLQCMNAFTTMHSKVMVNEPYVLVKKLLRKPNFLEEFACVYEFNNDGFIGDFEIFTIALKIQLKNEKKCYRSN